MDNNKKFRSNTLIIFVSIFTLSLLPTIIFFDYKLYALSLLSFFIFFFIYLKKSFKESVFYLLFVSIFIDVPITTWAIQTVYKNVPTVWESLPYIDFRYHFSFNLSYKIIISLYLLTIHLYEKKDKISSFFFSSINKKLFFIFVCLSALSASFAPNKLLSLFGLIQITYYYALLISSLEFFKNISSKRFYTYIFYSLVLIINAIGFFQIISQSPIGLGIEIVRNAAQYGFVTTDGSPIYRISGPFSHPTYFGSVLCMLLPLILSKLIQQISKKNSIEKYFLYTQLALTTINITFTFSRSSWITAFIIIISFTYFVVKNNYKKYLGAFLKILIAVLVPTILISPFLLKDRIQSFFYVNSIGNGKARVELIKHSLTFTKNNPFLGVGINHFTIELDKLELHPDMRFFVYPVHNTILLFFSELGVIAGIVFLLILSITLKMNLTLSAEKNDIISFSYALIIIAFLINSQFHTLFNQDPSFEILIISIAYLTTKHS